MILLFYATAAEAAKTEAAKRRAAKTDTRATECYACLEAEPCDGIEFTDDVPETEVKRLTALFGTDAATDDAGLTKAEIIADLEAMKVEFDPRHKRADLLAQRNAARASRDAV